MGRQFLVTEVTGSTAPAGPVGMTLRAKAAAALLLLLLLLAFRGCGGDSGDQVPAARTSATARP